MASDSNSEFFFTGGVREDNTEVVDEADPVCRICLDSEPSNELFQPCRCSGTMRFVHKSCLKDWRCVEGNNSKSYYECPQCKFQYNLKRVPLADFLASPLTSHSVTVLLLASCIVPCASFARAFFGHLFFQRLVWLQAMLAGGFIFGSGAFLIVGFLSAGAKIFDPILVYAGNVLRRFWNSVDLWLPGDVLAAFVYLALDLAGIGFFISANCVYSFVSSMVSRQLRKMESLVLAQVMDIQDAPCYAQSAPAIHSSRVQWTESHEEEEEEEED